jgi:hypothetical protein
MLPSLACAQAKDGSKESASSDSPTVSRNEFNDGIRNVRSELDALRSETKSVGGTLDQITLELQKLAKVVSSIPKEGDLRQPAPGSDPSVQPDAADAGLSSAGQGNVAAGPTPASPAGPTSAPGSAILSRQVSDLNDRLSDLEAAVGDIARKVSRGGRPGHVLKISESMEDPSFRNELSGAVLTAIPQHGRLRVRNAMGTTQYLMINRSPYSILPGQVLDVDVPAGTVTTELVGYESPRNWTIGPPNYQTQIAIGPQAVREAAYSGYDVSTPVLIW